MDYELCRSLWTMLWGVYKHILTVPENKNPEIEKTKNKTTVTYHTLGGDLKVARAVNVLTVKLATSMLNSSLRDLLILICLCICADNLIIRSSDCMGYALFFYVFVFLPTKISSLLDTS